MPIIATILASVLPMLIYLLIIWKMDKYEPEPLKFVLLHFLWGAIGAVGFAIIGSSILNSYTARIFDEFSLQYLEVVAFAPFIEELTKGIFLFLITLRSKRFDNLTDGLVYGGAIGLGFGMTENFMYFATYASDVSVWLMVVFLRTCFSAVMHCISTATLGAFLGISKLSPSRNKSLLISTGLVLAMFIHFFWNFSVINKATFFLGILYMIVLIILFITLFSLSLRKERTFIFEELNEEYQLGNIPLNHLTIISSSKRNKTGWINESFRKDYIKAATRLAFKKMESKHCSVKKKEYFIKEIEDQRKIIKELLLSSENS